MALTLRQKLTQVYNKIDHIEKKGRNKTLGYTFLRSADVLHALRKAFAELGVYAQTNVELLGTYDIKTSSGGNMHAATVKVIITLHDTESPDFLSISGIGDGADGGDKGIYKAQTGAIKNALRNAFLVPDEADPEADENVDEAVQEEKSLPKRTTRQVIAEERELTPDAPEPPSAPTLLTTPAPTGALPTPEELDKYRDFVVNLTQRLSASGELKASRDKRVSSKVLSYLLKCTGASDAAQITTTQWETLVAAIKEIEAKENGLKELAKLIEKTIKEK